MDVAALIGKALAAASTRHPHSHAGAPCCIAPGWALGIAAIAVVVATAWRIASELSVANVNAHVRAGNVDSTGARSLIVGKHRVIYHQTAAASAACHVDRRTVRAAVGLTLAVRCVSIKACDLAVFYLDDGRSSS